MKLRMRKNAKIFWSVVGTVVLASVLMFIVVFGGGLASMIGNHSEFATVPTDKVSILDSGSKPIYVPSGMKINGKVVVLIDADDKGIKQIGTMENETTSKEVLVLPAEEETVTISPES